MKARPPASLHILLVEDRDEDAALIVSWGRASTSSSRHGMLEPGLAYLQKPFRPDALVRKVREVLNSHRKPFPENHPKISIIPALSGECALT